MAAILECIGLTKRYGGILAVNDVSLRVEQGARHALVGLGDAAASAMFDLLSGAVPPTAGRILFEGRDITATGSTRRVEMGIVRTFAMPSLRGNLTALEALGAVVSERMGMGRRWWNRLGSRHDVIEDVAELIERCRLADVMHERTSALPKAKRRMLDIALALACRPRVLLLDEPAAGLTEDEQGVIVDTIRDFPPAMTVVIANGEVENIHEAVTEVSIFTMD